ncbi:2-oxo-4-hydroxy-4-carboxy-5-ureidoimidazoline decarboxylase [Amycolatopsis sp.]|uniref:2-oxo-4-hydroxy-4-carboxy-5-ureidoimidazoline decarboxylase n=1 Tax=Amycolatopsis sp. TaxID=37632 RepID=UPI002CF94158|nr:2-oxo-4-hydroxy-4-carboxy-5-ureidoimidazoline decarboxylase [Amycolatopsis sp.]HVV13663.1 2-oxo-4-hydroxy-4-carboxy-5-ureidoimidazoline decarboxylase [Amycolatopsis sp.]
MLNPQRQHLVEGSHWVSPVDFEPEVTDGFDFPEPLRVIDSTLRKTLFTAGHATSRLGFQRIAEALVDLGIEDESININWSGATHPGPQEWALLEAIVEGGFPFRLNVYTDTLLSNGRDHQPVSARQTVGELAAAGVRIAAPGILEAPDDAAQARQIEELEEYFEYAAQAGLETTITLAQVGRRDFGRMVTMVDHAVRLGATRLDLMDSTSSLTPEAMKVFVRRFRAALAREVPLTMHVHDEFGLATAGAIAAATAGAAPDVAMNGMSYRCGFAPLEEVVLALETLYGVDTGINLGRIQHVARVVERESGVELPALKPLTGRYAYLKNMPGDVAAAISQGQHAFPPISHGLVPSALGQELTWVWSGLSSEGMVRALAAHEGVDVTTDEVLVLRRAMDATVAAVPRYPRWLTAAQATARFHELLAGLRTPRTREELRAALAFANQHEPWIEAALVDADTAALIQNAWNAVSMIEDLPSMLAHCNPLGEAVPDDSARSKASAAEEAGVGEAPEITKLAAEYERRFGFRFVLATTGLGPDDVLARLHTRLAGGAEAELETARRELRTIIDNRLIARLT